MEDVPEYIWGEQVWSIQTSWVSDGFVQTEQQNKAEGRNLLCSN